MKYMSYIDGITLRESRLKNIIGTTLTIWLKESGLIGDTTKADFIIWNTVNRCIRWDSPEMQRIKGILQKLATQTGGQFDIRVYDSDCITESWGYRYFDHYPEVEIVLDVQWRAIEPDWGSKKREAG